MLSAIDRIVLRILSASCSLAFLNKAIRCLYISQYHLYQIYVLNFLKEISLQILTLQLQRKLLSPHQKGLCFSFTSKFVFCKVVIFLCVE